MKLAITSRGPNLDDPVDPRFGRARCYILFDVDAGELTVFDNARQIAASQGAGIQAAQNVVASGAGVVLTGRCGPNAFRVLSAAGVQVYAVLQGTVREAVQAWRQGDLELFTGPDRSPRRGRRCV